MATGKDNRSAKSVNNMCVPVDIRWYSCECFL